MQMCVELQGQITVDADPETAASIVEEHLDAVMEELLKLEAGDPSIELDLTDQVAVTFALIVSAPNPIDAVNIASGAIRTAIHAVGGGTPDWPDIASEAWSVRLLTAKSSPVEDPELLDVCVG